MKIRIAAVAIVTLFAMVLTLTYAQTRPATPKSWPNPPAMKIDVNKTYTATIDTTKGKIVLTLFAKEAPKTVNSFVFLAREKFYDGIIFHRVIKGFMIQTGDPTGTGTGGPGYQFENENQSSKRGFVAGTLGMARTQMPNSNGSQFFICDADSPLSPAQYTVFGEVKEGLDIVKAIAASPTDASDRPRTEIAMKSVTIEEK